MSTLARRADLERIQITSDDLHAGLTLTRLLVQHDDDHGTARKLMQDVVAHTSASGEAYRVAFDRWTDACRRQGSITFTATLLTPLAIGLGNASPQEVGLTLHHTYGMPYLPASALKGLLRRVVLQRVSLSAEQTAVLIGKTTEAGFIQFWDAWMEPTGTSPLMMDTITVHHPEYYKQQGKGKFPTDFDDPIPVPFISIRPGTRFMAAFNAPTLEWAEVTAHLLRAGLTHIGFGGKTNAGYGFFKCDEPIFPRPEAIPDSIILAIKQIRFPGDTGSITQKLLPKIDLIENLELKREALELLVAHLQQKPFWPPKDKEKSWYKAVIARLEEQLKK